MESTASPNSQPSRRWSFSRVSLPFHLVAASWVVVMLLLARYRPTQYVALLEEDRPIEWTTVWLFGAAGIIQLRRAIRHRFFFDALVAVFCLFVAGEEFSWGQRLIGYGSEYFLAHNYQQEVNLHNLPGFVVQPKWFFIAALTGYGILLPLMARSNRLARLMKRVGATAPPVQLAPWFLAAVVLLVWYPFTLTGEWVESLAGALFLASITFGSGTPWILLSLSLIFGVLMTQVTNRIEHYRDAERSACARKEIDALLDDLTLGDMATEKLKSQQTLHNRVWTAITEGYLDRQGAREFDGTKCGTSTDEAQTRRRYMVDPWGTSYWLSVQRVDDDLRVTVYSFGPNRQSDGSAAGPSGDDISASAYLQQVRKPDVQLGSGDEDER